MTCGIYGRKSQADERSHADGKSTERQREHGTAFAEQKGLRVDPNLVFLDDAVSGAEFLRRPGLARLLAAVEAKALDALVVMDQSRLGRDTVRTLGVIQAINDAGVAIHGYLDGREITVDGEMGEVESFMKGWKDTQVRRDSRKRVRDAFAQKKKLGYALGQRRYGYAITRVGGEDGHSEYVPDEAQKAVVLRIFQLAADGVGDKRIVDALAADRTPAPGPKGWSKNIVRRLLTNPIYVGRLVYDTVTFVDKGGKASKRVRVPEEQWTVVDAPHLAIVSHDLWAAVQSRKAKTRAAFLRAPNGQLQGRPESGLRASRLLSGGLGRCGVCGGALSHAGDRGEGRVRRYYCLERLRRGPAACASRAGIPMVDLDEAVLSELHDILINREDLVAAAYEAEIARLQRRREATSGEDVRHAAVAKLQAEITRLTDALAAGRALADIAAGIEVRRAKIADLTALASPEPLSVRAITGDEFMDAAPPNDPLAYAMRHLKKLQAMWGTGIDYLLASPLRARQLLRKVGVDKVTVTPGENGTWRFEGAMNLGGQIAVDEGSTAPPGVAQRDLAAGITAVR
jgi:site-specific DNA recombinase